MLRFMSCVDVPCEKPFLNLRSHIFELDGDYFPSQRLVDNDRKQFLWVLLRSLIEPRAINKSHFHHNLIAVRAEEAEGSLTTLRLLRSCAWKRSFYRFSRRPLHRPLVSHHHWQWTAPTWAKNVSAIQRHGGSKQKTEWNYRFFNHFHVSFSARCLHKQNGFSSSSIERPKAEKRNTIINQHCGRWWHGSRHNTCFLLLFLSSIIVAGSTRSEWRRFARCWNHRKSSQKKIKKERMSSAVYAHECFMSEKAPPGKPSFILWNLLCACSLMNWRYHRMHRPSPAATRKQVAAFHSRKLTESFSNWKTFLDKSGNLNNDCMTSFLAVNEPSWRKKKKSSSQLNVPHICDGFHCDFHN